MDYQRVRYLLQIVGAFAIYGLAGSAQAATIADSYVGWNDQGYGDVIGNTSHFQIFDMDVSMSGSVLSVSVHTTFAGKGDDGLFSSVSDSLGIGYGDLFLSSAWNPHGSAPYLDDQASNGTVWEYGFSLDDRWMSEGSDGTGMLYRLNSGNNVADTLGSDDFMTGAIYRNGQEVAVDVANGDVTALSPGSWAIDAVSQRVNFEIDLAGTGLIFDEHTALRWQMSCANDVIEGSSVSAVPVPAAAWLFSTGLVGLVAVARRKVRD